MISADILSRLVPETAPEATFPLPAQLRGEGRERQFPMIALWAAYLRFAIAQRARDDGHLRNLIEESGFVGTGIFRSSGESMQAVRRFPLVDGFQFGSVLLRGALSDGERPMPHVPLGKDGYQIPLQQAIATINDHASPWADGHSAAVFEDSTGTFGVTARHVVERFRPGQRVPIFCSDCSSPAVLVRKAPGLIDAAIVRFPCGGPIHRLPNKLPQIRGALEGETVDAHYGGSGRKNCTVMMSLSTPVQILSAAAPKHFLLDRPGVFGDSGSLVSATGTTADPPDLLGMYLGDCDCDDGKGSMVRYGYALDLDQAARILGANNLKGDAK